VIILFVNKDVLVFSVVHREEIKKKTTKGRRKDLWALADPEKAASADKLASSEEEKAKKVHAPVRSGRYFCCISSCPRHSDVDHI
jgi:hypothetical protein